MKIKWLLGINENSFVKTEVWSEEESQVHTFPKILVLCLTF